MCIHLHIYLSCRLIFVGHWNIKVVVPSNENVVWLINHRFLDILHRILCLQLIVLLLLLILFLIILVVTMINGWVSKKRVHY